MANILDTISSKAKGIEQEMLKSSENLTQDPLSYRTFLQDMIKFRQAGGTRSSAFNDFDTPANIYFRILFHFVNSDAGGRYSDITPDGGMGSGLLHPTWLYVQQPNSSDNSFRGMAEMKDYEISRGDKADELVWYGYNTAFAYLMENDEMERAEALYNFINLLSNINSESPWYWQKISGLDEAMNRLQTGGEFTFKADRGKISIECLPDAVDQRIGTLLDLYRTAVWSWQQKKEIIPANLRKFDMTIIIFESPLQSLHHPLKKPKLSDALGMVSDWIEYEDTDYATVNREQSNSYLTSYKVIELHNCEIDYNSSRTGYESLDNAGGKEQLYKIEIFYEDAYEQRYNEFSQQELGDILAIDSLRVDRSSITSDDIFANQNWPDGYDTWNASGNEKTNGLPTKKTDDNPVDRSDRFIHPTITDQVMGMVTDAAANKTNSIVLGNLFGLSLTDVASRARQISSGHVGAMINTAKGIMGTKTSEHDIGDNIFQDSKDVNAANTEQAFSRSKTSSQRVQELGNIFRSRTIINNI